MIGLLRMVRWARNPPSWRMVRLGLAVIAACLALVAAERLGWWPDAARLEPAHHGLRRR